MTDATTRAATKQRIVASLFTACGDDGQRITPEELELMDSTGDVYYACEDC
jgi:hypothetical protein